VGKGILKAESGKAEGEKRPLGQTTFHIPDMIEVSGALPNVGLARVAATSSRKPL